VHSAGHVNEHFCLFAAFITADTKGKWVVCGSEDNSIFLWDLNKKEVSCLLILQHSLYYCGYTGRIQESTFDCGLHALRVQKNMRLA